MSVDEDVFNAMEHANVLLIQLDFRLEELIRNRIRVDPAYMHRAADVLKRMEDCLAQVTLLYHCDIIASAKYYALGEAPKYAH